MKYCPYCGAVLADSAASFCSECGKVLPSVSKSSKPVLETRQIPVSMDTQERSVSMSKQERLAGKHQPSNGSKQGHPLPQKRRKTAGKKQFPFFPTPAQKRPEIEQSLEPDPRDEGYDGYYDDVKPIDSGYVRERMEPELIKRIIIIAAGAFVLVIFSVILMYLL
jgi:DNA-directed RNA polymerase subunit M/transcription elongation factor TFIIS